MADVRPITFQEHLQLTALGIPANAITFQSCTLTSDRFVCVRENVGDKNQVAILDLANPTDVIRRPIQADSAIMHPTEKIIALKAGQQLQIFNLSNKQKVTSHVFSEDVVYWCFLSPTLLGLVTPTAVWHWDISNATNTPRKLFDRHPSLNNAQIIGYKSNEEGTWMVLIGILSNPDPQGFKVKGALQLYSVARKISQPIEGHAACFGNIRLDGAPNDTNVFVFASRTAQGAKLHIVEIDHKEANPAFPKKAVDVFFDPSSPADFPVSIQISRKHGIIMLVTKLGFIHLYDLETAACIYMNRISGETIFVTCEYEQTGGMLMINRSGQVLSVSVNEDSLVPYILSTLNNQDLAFKLASRGNLPGADDLYVGQFRMLMSSGNYGEAAKIAANSPRGILRTPTTIEGFKSVQVAAGQMSPILQYFGILLEKGELNKYETLELVRPVLAQGRKQLFEKWLKENKLECSEELGDVVRAHDLTLALAVYLRASVPNKVVACFAETGQFSQIVKYSNKVGYTPDYPSLLQHIVRQNPDQAAEFATQLVNSEGGSLVDIEKVVDIFAAQNNVQQATSFLLDALKDNLPEQAHLQTRLLEMNLMTAPPVADAILSNNMFSHYDKPRIAHLAEKAGLLQRALELFEDTADIKRVVVHTNMMPTDWLVEYFGQMTVDQSLACLHEMMKANMRQNLQVVVQIATKYSDLLGPLKLIEMFESFKSSEGLYYYLGSVVNLSQDKEVNFKYIQAATRTGQLREVERICRESNFYDAEKVKNFLKEAKLQDQLPLIIVCDRFDFVHDLVLYLYQNGLVSFIETYVQKVNSSRLPQVVGGLLDVDCDEMTIKKLLVSVAGSFDIDALVTEVESRNRLKLLLPWLESKIAAGQQDTALYNAIAKISIDSNNNAEAFLKENNIYDPIIVGKYCEKRDPYLAYIAYAKGFCDEELIAITNDNAMYKHQARYLVKRRQLDLWAQVLQSENDHRGPLLDQVISTAVPESTDADDVSVTVKAFMLADLPGPMVKILEKIILEPSPFSDNKSLQSLLLLTAIRTDKSKVMGYIDKLSGYDSAEIARIATEHGLNEEAFCIYKKHGQNLQALNVLVEFVLSIDRAAEFTKTINEPALWSRLGKVQLDALRVKDSIDSYTKADDPSNYAEVIEIANRSGKNDELVRFLQMARKSLREPMVDTELAFSYARAGRLSEMEEFLGFTNVADLSEVGEKCFSDELYSAAKLVFTSISNYSRLATTLIYLDENQAAVEAAQKAGNTQVWKQVHAACIDKKDFRLAQICALNLVVHAEELQALNRIYERKGYFNELMSLLEAGLGLERAHMGMFSELAILYAKYKPEKCMEHLKLFASRINIPKVLKSVEQAHLWPELVYLYVQYGEFDNAALAMIERSEDAWTHDKFKDIIVKVANIELYYSALTFYLDCHPTLLTDLLAVLKPRIDHTRVVRMFKSPTNDNIPLIKPYLIAVQHLNIAAVNEAYHELLIEEEDWKSLRASFDAHDNFDALSLAKRLRDHELMEFRRLAASLYRKNKRWEDSISLSKQDKLFKDAIETASTSESVEIVEELLSYFTEIGVKEAFTATLYTCYSLVMPDYVAELVWTHGLNDYAMPYKIQVERDNRMELAALRAEIKHLKESGIRDPQTDNDMPIMAGAGFGNLMITNGNMAPSMTGMPQQMTGYPQQMF